MLVEFEGFAFVECGVVAPQGFMAAGVHCGIRQNKDKKDLSLLTAAGPVPAAGSTARRCYFYCKAAICPRQRQRMHFYIVFTQIFH